jgi:hypothetical protein
VGEKEANAEWKDLATVAADETGVGESEATAVRREAVCKIPSRSAKFDSIPSGRCLICAPHSP